MKDFEIKYSGLSEGQHHFEFAFDKTILNADFEALDITDISGVLKLTLEKKTNLMTLGLQYQYKVESPCSRCNELFWTPIALEEQLFLKVTDEAYAGEDENIEHIGTHEHQYNIFNRLLEDVKLGIPLILAHEETVCSFDALMENLEDNEADEEDEIDERWNALKELKNKLDKEQ